MKVNQRPREAYRLHLQGQRVSQARNQHEVDNKQSLLHAYFLLDLLSDLEIKFDN
jgi:hypothetical protein